MKNIQFLISNFQIMHRALNRHWKLEIGNWKFQNKGFTPTPERAPFARAKCYARLVWGFTLLEMIISFGIFSLLVVASTGVTLGVSNAQIKAANVQTLLDNIRFSLELITKEMRTGTGYSLTVRCAPSGSEMSFTTSLGEPRTYFLSSGAIMRAKVNITSSDCADTSKVKPLTSEDVIVERLNFSQLRGQNIGPGDGQPQTTITLKVKSRSPKYELESSMDLQTTVVQRLRDL